ncbi:MAG: hypothetical protein MUC96_33145 [Myxococcaceae bacterium]|jgi:hypothetical protein|nr:hypothetical protein [Myxococcaceae bacterium]
MTIRRSMLWCLAALTACGPMDAPVDAGAPDAGARADGGASGDAGTVVDAGAVVDAGTVVDAGQPMDAGLRPDAGMSGADAGVRFSVDVAPALQVCTGCHSERNTWADVRARVTPGDPATSVLYQRVTSQARPMPPSGPLSTSNPQGTANLEAWIRAGALDN